MPRCHRAAGFHGCSLTWPWRSDLVGAPRGVARGGLRGIRAFPRRPDAGRGDGLHGGGQFRPPPAAGGRVPEERCRVEGVEDRRCRGRPRSRGHLRRVDASAAERSPAVPGAGFAHRRLSADPQRRHARREHRHGFAGGRHAPGARRARRHDGARQQAGPAYGRARRAHRRPEAHHALCRRGRRRDPSPGCSRLAGVLEGRHAQRHGHRRRQRRARRRLGREIGPLRARVGRARCNSCERGGGAPRFAHRLVGANPRRRTDRHRGVQCSGAFGRATDRRSSLHRGLPPARSRSLRAASGRARASRVELEGVSGSRSWAS